MKVDFVEISRHFAFSRHGIKLVFMNVAHLNYICEDASFELITNLAILIPKKLQCFYGTLLCYVTPYLLCRSYLSFESRVVIED